MASGVIASVGCPIDTERLSPTLQLAQRLFELVKVDQHRHRAAVDLAWPDGVEDRPVQIVDEAP